jgi:hypothetical protein
MRASLLGRGMLIGAISTSSLAAKSRAAKTPHPLNFEGAKKVSQADTSSSLLMAATPIVNINLRRSNKDVTIIVGRPIIIM